MDRVEKVFASRIRYMQAVKYDFRNGRNGGYILTFPGLKNGDFNRAGLPSIDKVARLSEISRLGQSAPSDDDEKTNDMDFFTLGIVVKGRLWTFTPEFYRRAATNFPITLCGGISRVGRTSIDTFQTYFANDSVNSSEEGTSKQVAILTCAARLVVISAATRRPFPMTEDHARKLSSQVVAGAQTFPTFNQPDSIPESAFKWRVQVRYDDIDTEFHANQASYLMYATECAAHAARERYYSRIVEDIAFYPVKRACGLYISEALVDDELEVSTWEDADDKMCLHFAICKQGKMIFYAQLDFFDSIMVQSSL